MQEEFKHEQSRKTRRSNQKLEGELQVTTSTEYDQFMRKP